MSTAMNDNLPYGTTHFSTPPPSIHSRIMFFCIWDYDGWMTDCLVRRHAEVSLLFHLSSPCFEGAISSLSYSSSSMQSDESSHDANSLSRRFHIRHNSPIYCARTCLFIHMLCVFGFVLCSERG